VRGEHHARPVRHLVELVHEHRAAALQVGHHVGVVHDLLAHVHRRPLLLEQLLDDLDRPLHTGAERPRPGEQDPPLAGRRRPPGQGRPGRPQRPQRAQPPGQRGRAAQRPLRRVGDGPHHRQWPPAGRARQPRRLQVHGQRGRVHRPRLLPAPRQPLHAHHRPGPDHQPGPAELPRQQRRRRAGGRGGPVRNLGGHHQITRSKIVGQPPTGSGNGQRAERILPEPPRVPPCAPRPVPANPDLAAAPQATPNRPGLRQQRGTYHEPGTGPGAGRLVRPGAGGRDGGRLGLRARRYLGDAVGADSVRRHDAPAWPARYRPSALTGNTSR
jgi:hypothetical protein